jgi:uncharacterized phiE125 gp8 family phage protein
MRNGIGWTLQRTVEPGRVVTLDEMKDHMNIVDDDTQDVTIDEFVVAAEDFIEKELCRALLTQTWVLKLDRFPCFEIRLPRPPLASVSSVTYLDQNGALQTLAGSYYTVDTTGEPGRLYLAYGQTWPLTYAVPNAVTVTYLAGKTTPEQVASMIKLAIKLTAADMFENRERERGGAALRAGANDFYEKLTANYRCVTDFNYI